MLLPRTLLVSMMIALAGAALAAETPDKPDKLGRGSRLGQVTVAISADGEALKPVVEDWVLPAGRESLAPNGATVYAATLPGRSYEHEGMTFNYVPTISVTTSKDGVQEVDVNATFNSRTFGGNAVRTDNTRFEVTVSWTSPSGVRQSQTDSIFTSCLDGDTLITLWDGQRAPIRELAPGEWVRDPLTGAGLRIRTVIRGPEPIPLIAVTWAGGTVRFSEGHPLPTAAGVRAAKDVVAGDRVRGTDARWHEVESVARVGPVEGQMVYNLEVEPGSMRPEDHLIVAGGLVVGDSWLQDELAAGRIPVIAWDGPPVGR